MQIGIRCRIRHRVAILDYIVKKDATAMLDGLAKSLVTVMPDLIRHPELFEITGFGLPPE